MKDPVYEANENQELLIEIQGRKALTQLTNALTLSLPSFPLDIIQIVDDYAWVKQEENIAFLRLWLDKVEGSNHWVNAPVYLLAINTIINLGTFITILSLPSASNYLEGKIFLGAFSIVLSAFSACHLSCVSCATRAVVQDTQDLKTRLQLPANNIDIEEYNKTLSQVKTYLHEMKKAYKGSSNPRSDYDPRITLLFNFLNTVLSLSFGIVSLCYFPKSIIPAAIATTSNGLSVGVGIFCFFKNQQNIKDRKKDYEILDSHAPNFSKLLFKR